MKAINKLFTTSILVIAVGMLLLLAPAATKGQAKLEKTITAHINKIREDAVEYKEARKVIYGDVNGDQTKDVVVQYTLEGAGGSNSWGQNLAVFLNKKGVYKLAAEEAVGGKFFRSFDVLRVVNKEIIGATETCPSDTSQGICENPAKKQVKFVLVNGKLSEK